jgi:hypothetical protein
MPSARRSTFPALARGLRAVCRHFLPLLPGRLHTGLQGILRHRVARASWWPTGEASGTCRARCLTTATKVVVSTGIDTGARRRGPAWSTTRSCRSRSMIARAEDRQAREQLGLTPRQHVASSWCRTCVCRGCSQIQEHVVTAGQGVTASRRGQRTGRRGIRDPALDGPTRRAAAEAAARQPSRSRRVRRRPREGAATAAHGSILASEY